MIILFLIIILFLFEEFDKNYDENKTSKIFNKRIKENNCVDEININDIARKKEINSKKSYKISKKYNYRKKIISKIFLNHLILWFVRNFLKVKLEILIFLIII